MSQLGERSVPKGKVLASLVECLRRVFATNRRLTVGLLLLLTVQALCPVAMAAVVKRLIDALQLGVADSTTQGVPEALIWLAVEAALTALLVVARHVATHTRALLMLEFNHSIRQGLITDVMRRPLVEREDAGFQDRFGRVWRDASDRPLAMALKGFALIQFLVLGAGSFVLLGDINPWLALGVTVGAVPAFVAEARFSKQTFGFYDWAEPMVRRQAYVEHLVSDERYARELRTLGLQDKLKDDHHQVFKALHKPRRQLAKQHAALGSLFRLLSVAVIYGLSGWLVLQALGGHITIGTLVMGLALLKEGSSAVTGSLDAVAGIVDDHRYVDLLQEHLAAGSIEASPKGDASGPELADGLRVEELSFAYPGSDKLALDGVSLHLKPGQTLALVGVNGAGKSTLVKQVCGLYEPDSGEVSFQGRPIRDWNRDALLARISVILQDFIRYQWTMEENIQVGDIHQEHPTEHLEEVLNVSQARTLVDSLKHGLKTQLGRWFEGGVDISGGQWQRVALARMFFRSGAELWILDEPSAALDIHAEVKLHETLRQNAGQKMVLLISHRFATVRHADEILVLEEGRVVERGNHDELMAAKGLYHEMFEKQAEGLR